MTLDGPAEEKESLNAVFVDDLIKFSKNLEEIRDQ